MVVVVVEYSEAGAGANNIQNLDPAVEMMSPPASSSPSRPPMAYRIDLRTRLIPLGKRWRSGGKIGRREVTAARRTESYLSPTVHNRRSPSPLNLLLYFFYFFTSPPNPPPAQAGKDGKAPEASLRIKGSPWDDERFGRWRSRRRLRRSRSTGR